ncbi:MAG: TetR family transcriptional regulator [Nonomuraea muscovyensis]|nr:TetR family transcriptional regulator [Nonomuraea muscovyensis]
MRSKNELSGQKAGSFIEEGRRAQTIASAVGVIADLGFAQASPARIAQHTGVSKGVISHHVAVAEHMRAHRTRLRALGEINLRDAHPEHDLDAHAAEPADLFERAVRT